MAFRNIAVSGRIGAGTSTLAKQLSQTLGWPLRDASQIFRDISMQIGHDLEKSPQRYADEIDLRVDNDSISTLKSLSGIIVASKLAGFLSRDIKHTLRVLITCPLDERIRRYSQSRGHSLAQAKKLLILREKLDQEKWRRLYENHDFFNPKHFHLILDSSSVSVSQEIAAVIRSLSLLS